MLNNLNSEIESPQNRRNGNVSTNIDDVVDNLDSKLAINGGHSDIIDYVQKSWDSVLKNTRCENIKWYPSPNKTTFHVRGFATNNGRKNLNYRAVDRYNNYENGNRGNNFINDNRTINYGHGNRGRNFKNYNRTNNYESGNLGSNFMSDNRTNSYGSGYRGSNFKNDNRNKNLRSGSHNNNFRSANHNNNFRSANHNINFRNSNRSDNYRTFDHSGTFKTGDRDNSFRSHQINNGVIFRDRNKEVYLPYFSLNAGIKNEEFKPKISIDEHNYTRNTYGHYQINKFTKQNKPYQSNRT
ncbi:GATA zinc finger domain-containing protein 14-like [Daktulosphaira vitifoliae]|uniref:GATA zinc finger domain-containing protein 14-like n=1 Tax=Daktulosphaira vitifoliae TaxID=58002 RepID=UPI0021AA6CE9|nr:GATA zinc finger domain-containing protein 14-like [Daktulosphaira vitifoliae]